MRSSAGQPTNVGRSSTSDRARGPTVDAVDHPEVDDRDASGSSGSGHLGEGGADGGLIGARRRAIGAAARAGPRRRAIAAMATCVPPSLTRSLPGRCGGRR